MADPETRRSRADRIFQRLRGSHPDSKPADSKPADSKPADSKPAPIETRADTPTPSSEPAPKDEPAFADGTDRTQPRIPYHQRRTGRGRGRVSLRRSRRLRLLRRRRRLGPTSGAERRRAGPRPATATGPDQPAAPAPSSTAAAASPAPVADAPAALPGQGVHPGARRALPRIFAVANQKGGVGKTTTAVNLSAALAEEGYRVLVVDLDPQGNATTGLGVNARNLEHSVYDALLHDVPLDDIVEATSLRNLFVVPSTIDLAGAEIELVPMFSRELRLRKALEPVRDEFDYVLIDCPPSLGLLTVNGLAAADEVVVPIQCEYYALEGVGQLMRNVNLVRSNLNSGLEVTTIIMTMYDARTKLAEQVVKEVRSHFGDRVCRNIVPRTVRLSEAPSFGQPIIVFDPSSRGAIAYRELAKEVSGGAPQRVG